MLVTSNLPFSEWNQIFQGGADDGTFSAGADTAGQFQQWTPRQFRGRKPLINRDLLQGIAPLFPRKLYRAVQVAIGRS